MIYLREEIGVCILCSWLIPIYGISFTHGTCFPLFWNLFWKKMQYICQITRKKHSSSQEEAFINLRTLNDNMDTLAGCSIQESAMRRKWVIINLWM